MKPGSGKVSGDRGLVELALDRILRAAVIKTEDPVVDAATIHKKGQAVVETDAALGVELEMRIEVVVAKWAAGAGAITRDVRCVIGETHTRRDAPAVIRRADVPGVRR